MSETVFIFCTELVYTGIRLKMYGNLLRVSAAVGVKMMQANIIRRKIIKKKYKITEA